MFSVVFENVKTYEENKTRRREFTWCYASGHYRIGDILIVSEVLTDRYHLMKSRLPTRPQEREGSTRYKHCGRRGRGQYAASKYEWWQSRCVYFHLVLGLLLICLLLGLSFMFFLAVFIFFIENMMTIFHFTPMTDAISTLSICCWRDDPLFFFFFTAIVLVLWMDPLWTGTRWTLTSERRKKRMTRIAARKPRKPRPLATSGLGTPHYLFSSFIDDCCAWTDLRWTQPLP